MVSDLLYVPMPLWALQVDDSICAFPNTQDSELATKDSDLGVRPKDLPTSLDNSVMRTLASNGGANLSLRPEMTD